MSKIPTILADALNLPNGARFFRCALQLNPFGYLVRHGKQTSLASEEDYNRAIVDACLAEGIEVVAVTDHYRIHESGSLIEAARAAGIHVFPGFEAVTKDGVHLLCFLNPAAPLEMVQARINECGIHNTSELSPAGKYDTAEFFEECDKWGALCVAAHVEAENGGLLRVLKGQARIRTWRQPGLMACSLPGPVEAAPQRDKGILLNKEANHKRDRPVAILNCQDVSDPADLSKPGSSCWIKMSQVTIEGLRQAFLDPVSRLRLLSDPEPEDHAVFRAIAWEGGFLDGAAVHLNENLNVLIGGRGAGKSTVVESIRYALQLSPLGDEARKAHEGIVRQVLKSGTRVSLLVSSPRPSRRDYVIERTAPNPPVVKDAATGDVLPLTPRDILPRVEVFGQHEISELARSPDRLTRLLARFVDTDPDLEKRKSDARRDLSRSRKRLLEIREETEAIKDRLAGLPAVEETLKRYQEAGLEERLREKSLLIREERILQTAIQRIEPLQELLDALRENLPIDRAFLSEKSLDGLPGGAVLQKLDAVLGDLEQSADDTARSLEAGITKARSAVAAVQAEWDDRRKRVEQDYEKILRDLQRTKVDGEEFIRLRRELEELRPLRERRSSLEREEQIQIQARRNVLAEWEDAKRAEFQQLNRAARAVSARLGGRVRVEVLYAGNRAPLETLLREGVGGRLNDTLEILSRRPDLSVLDLAAACRSGKEQLASLGIPAGQAERLAQAGESFCLLLEELELPSTTRIELNVAPEEGLPLWKGLDELSTGQKSDGGAAAPPPGIRCSPGGGSTRRRPRQPLHHRRNCPKDARREAAEAVPVHHPQRQHPGTGRR